MTDLGKYFTNNVVKGIALLDAMRDHACDRFVFSSIAAPFGEPQHTPIYEAHPLRSPSMGITEILQYGFVI